MQANPVFFTDNKDFRFWRPHLHIDQIAFREVVLDNCYLLPGHFPPGFVCVDIGAHIGSFCYATLDRGAQAVFACEADPRNHAKLVENLANHRYGGRVRARHAAAWRSDQPEGTLDLALFDESRQDANTGGGSVVLAGDFVRVTVPAIPLATVLDAARSAGGGTVHLLKMDCEGAEFPMLYTTDLKGVQAICMELHVNMAMTADSAVAGFENTEACLTRHLEQQGFETRRAEGFQDRPYLFAERRAS